MKIILADAHGPVRGKPQASPNLGLLYIASYMQERVSGVSVQYVPQRYELEDHFKLIEETKPDIYAMSFTSYGALVAYDAIHRLKARFPDLLIICGGPHPSAAAKDVLEKTEADICVIGEGEETFVDLAKNFDSLPDKLDHIQGIAYLKEGEFHQTLPRPLIEDLDTIPLPNRALIDDVDYAGSALRMNAPDTDMIITRGCPLRCVFCANPVFRVKDGPLFRKRSPEAIAVEIRLLYEMGYRELYLHSDELNVEHDWAVEVCKAIASLGYSDLYFQCNMRVAPMSEELAIWLRKANFWMIRFGIESASNRVLGGIKKQMAHSRTERALHLMKEQNIKVFGFFMMFQVWQNKDGTLNYETADEVNQTLNYIWDVWRQGLLHYISWQVAVPVHGAEMHDIVLRHGLVDSNYYPDQEWIPSNYLPDVSQKQFNSVIRRGRLLQGSMAFRNGAINWNNWPGLVVKAKDMVLGRQTK